MVGPIASRAAGAGAGAAYGAGETMAWSESPCHVATDDARPWSTCMGLPAEADVALRWPFGPCSWSLVNKSSTLDFFTPGHLDVTRCPRCSSALRLVEIATRPEAIQRVMKLSGLAPMPPPAFPVPVGQQQLSF